MNEIGIRLHGVTLTLASDHAPLLEHARKHLRSMIVPVEKNPAFTVRCSWSGGKWKRRRNPFSSEQVLDPIGKRMLGASDELIWLDTLRMKGLSLRFRQAGERWLFDASFCADSSADEGDLSESLHRNYFTLMNYLVLYPILWSLERVRGWTVVHGSGLNTALGGILICGLGGVGKTTACVALMNQPGATLLSENLILVDGESLYPFPEPIRLDETSRSLLGSRMGCLERMSFPVGLKKKWLYHPRKKVSSDPAPSSVVVFPRFSRERRIVPLSSGEAAEKMGAMNRLSREVNDYYWYASALEMMFPRPGQGEARVRRLSELTANARCYTVGVDRSQSVEAVVEDLLFALGNRPVARS